MSKINVKESLIDIVKKNNLEILKIDLVNGANHLLDIEV